MPQASLEDMRALLLRELEAAAPAHDVDIVDVEVVGVAKAPTVRVRIDHASPEAGLITLDEVSANTAWISDLVDEIDPIEGRFTLEVSSPGMARPLRKAADFERFAGSTVAVALVPGEGRRRFTGVLGGIEDGVVSVACDDGTFSFELEQIKTCAIKPDFANLGNNGAKGPKGGSRSGRR